MSASRCMLLRKWLPSRGIVYVLFAVGMFLLGVVLVERGLYGKFELGHQSLVIVLMITFPGIAFCGISFLWAYEGSSKQHFRTSAWCKKPCIVSFIAIIISSIICCAYYMSSRGLWCVYRLRDQQKQCDVACTIQRTLKAKGIPTWLTLGDMLAIHRNRTMPFPWEHDIDLCVSKDQFTTEFTRELKRGTFNPAPSWLGPKHVYFIWSKERARHAEGTQIDVWECDPVWYGATQEQRKHGLNGSFVNVEYCGCTFAVPKMEHRDRIFRKFFGNDYMVQRIAHHAWQCKIWVDS